MNNRLARGARTWIERRIHEHSGAPVLDAAQFPWTREVERLSPGIRREALALLPFASGIANFDQVLPGQRALIQGDSWKSFFLTALGKPVAEHQKICPVTCEALQHIPGLINAFFSILAPGVHIPPHRGPYAGVLRYHLGLVIPEGDVAIRVDQQLCRWAEGKSLVFDDSFEHEAWNRTESTRVILFVDLVRPLPTSLSVWNRLFLGLFERSAAAQDGLRTVLETQLRV